MIRLSSVALLCAWLFGVAFIGFGRSVLPAKYYTDSDRMGSLAELADPGRASKSDVATLQFYQLLGLRGIGMTPWAGLFNLTTAFALLAVLLRERRSSPVDVMVMFPWFAIMAIYLSMYSKEYLTVVCVAVLMLGARSRNGILLGITALAAYGTFVRAYWLLVVAYAVAVGIVLRLPVSRPVKVGAILLGVLGSLFAFNLITGFHLTDARTLLVAFRAGDADSQTLVQNVVENATPLHDLVNLTVGWLRFLVPLSLLSFGGAQHVVFCLLQIATVGYVAVSIVRDARLKGSWDDLHRREMVVVVAIGIGVTLVLSAFDGDFGSYARHQIALVPWLIVALCPRLEG